MSNERLKQQVLKSICSLKERGYDVVIVHGGGPFIREALREARIESEFIDGHRKTTSEAFEYVEMALKGKVNSSLVGIINTLGYRAVGLSGKDGQTVTASKRMHRRVVDGKVEELDLGQVGDVAEVDTTLIETLLVHDFIPVITCLATDVSGSGYNINGDMFAGHLAGALRARQYVVLTDVDGLLRDKEDPATLINDISLSGLNELVEQEIIKGGMIPKIESCEIAINKGAHSARIINGTVPEQILTLIDGQPVGTTITKN